MRLINEFRKTLMMVSVALLLSVSVDNAQAIKKCQDADGKWHYGDMAVQECENAKVTTLSKQGFVKSKVDAPKTKDEIEAEQKIQQAEETAEQKALKEQEQRNRILSVYQSEADIDRQLDNQIYSVDSNIAVHEVYLKGMADKVERLKGKQASLKGKRRDTNQIEIDAALAKIKESQESLGDLRLQKEQIQERFAKEKELYRSFRQPS